MKKIGVILLAGVLASLISSAAMAGPPANNLEAGTRRVDRREALQRSRIVEGRRSGELTRRELARLNAGQRQVHRMERRAEGDGIVTRGERRCIERVQDRQSRAIYRLKHNARQRA